MGNCRSGNLTVVRAQDIGRAPGILNAVSRKLQNPKSPKTLNPKLSRLLYGHSHVSQDLLLHKMAVSCKVFFGARSVNRSSFGLWQAHTASCPWGLGQAEIHQEGVAEFNTHWPKTQGIKS